MTPTSSSWRRDARPTAWRSPRRSRADCRWSATATGATAKLVGRAAGWLVPPGDVHALARALVVMIENADARARFAAGARRSRRRLPTWDDAAEKMARVLEQMERDHVG